MVDPTLQAMRVFSMTGGPFNGEEFATRGTLAQATTEVEQWIACEPSLAGATFKHLPDADVLGVPDPRDTAEDFGIAA
jgi:hypothetical protein